MKKTRSSPRKAFAAARTDDKPGPDSAGQSGDTQGLSDIAGADSESVRELLEEGNSFEAEAVMGVENVPDADESGIHLKQVREDDVPREYDDDTPASEIKEKY